MNEAAKKAFLAVQEAARVESDILGFVVTGSRGKGFATPYSDYDFAIFVKDDALETYRTRYQKVPYGAHLYIFTVATFEAYLAWDSERTWDKYTWAHLNVAFDRTDGKLKQMLDEMSRIPEAQVKSYIEFSLRYFINQVYHSVKCLRVDDQIGYRFEAAEGIKPFLQAVFCLHDRRPLAFYKYLPWELEHYPLDKLSFSSDELLQTIQSILDTGDYRAQQSLLREVARIFPAEGFSSALDSWERGYKWAMTFKPSSE